MVRLKAANGPPVRRCSLPELDLVTGAAGGCRKRTSARLCSSGTASCRGDSRGRTVDTTRALTAGLVHDAVSVLLVAAGEQAGAATFRVGTESA